MLETVGQSHRIDYKKNYSSAVNFALGLSGMVVFLLFWQLMSAYSDRPQLFPSPTRVLAALYDLFMERDFIHDVWSSLKRIITSFSIAAAIALPLGLIMGAFAPIRAFLGPLTSAGRYLPATAFVPLLLMWLGTGEEQKIALLTIGVLFFLITLIIDNTLQTPTDFINTSQTLGGSRKQILWTVVVPACLPAYVDTLRQMLAVGWTYLVVAEIVAATDGIGAMMMRAKRFVRVDDILAGIIIIGVLGLILDSVFRLIHRCSFPYLHQKPIT